MTTAIDIDRITSGFTDPVFDSQNTFRKVMEAMTHPGRNITINTGLEPPMPLHGGSAAICLTLLDFETTLWSDLDPDISALSWLYFHSGCRRESEKSKAAFALVTDAESLPPLEYFQLGTDECPDRSTTLIIQVNGISFEEGKTLAGPGIESHRKLKIDGISKDFWKQWQAQFDIFPLGVDVIFTCENTIAAIPRSTRVEG